MPLHPKSASGVFNDGMFKGVPARAWWVLALCVGMPLAVVAVLAYLIVFYDGRQDIDLGRWVGPQSSYDREMMPNPRWATDDLCDDALPCIQAVRSDTLTMYTFDDREDAVAAAASFGDDGYLTGWIAVRYERGALTASQRSSFEYGISCINTWVGEEGQDC